MKRSWLSNALGVLTLLAVAARGGMMLYDRHQREESRASIEQMVRSPAFQSRGVCVGVCANEPVEAQTDCELACFQIARRRSDLDLGQVYAGCKLTCAGQPDAGPLLQCANGCLESLGKTGAYGDLHLP